MEFISTEEVYEKLNQDQVKIIDVRPIEAYNGWKIRNELRNGHIKNARSLPFKWIKYIDWIEIVRSKNIYPEQTIIIYGYDIEKIKQVAYQFKKTGYEHVLIYPYFIEEWNKKSSYPMEYLPRYKHLVSAEWLRQLIKTNKAPTFENEQYIICHAHYQNRSDYQKGHIPKAIELDTNTLESQDTWNRRSPEELKLRLEHLGITHDTTVILYGRFSHPDNADSFPGSSAGQLGAIRCALIMIYAGVKDVRILNGGLQSWIDAGHETTTKEFLGKPVDEFGITIPANPEIIIDIDDAKEYLKSSEKNLISVRSWDEYIGNVSGYHYIEKKGRIPGAVFGNCGSDAYHMENYRNPDHTIREASEVGLNLKKQGITPEKFNAFYCGTGWRASEAFFNVWLMGWPHVSVFDGGWFEWTNSGNAYDTGKPENMEKKLVSE